MGIGNILCPNVNKWLEDDEPPPLMTLDEEHHLITNGMMSVGTIEDAKSLYRGDYIPIKGAEVGDDRVDFSISKYRISFIQCGQSILFGMKTSKHDTSNSAVVMNFCEVTTVVPTDICGSYHYCRKQSDFSTLDYVDIIPMRILIDVGKSDEIHSSSRSGKASMLASRSRAPRESLRKFFHVANLFQDTSLKTISANEPKYLPRIMGGTGSPILFGNPVNLYLYVHAYKWGTYQRVYASSTAEIINGMNALVCGGEYSLPLTRRLRVSNQQLLHGTWGNKIYIPSTDAFNQSIGIDPSITALYYGQGKTAVVHACEQRIRQARLMSTRDEAIIHLNKRNKVINYLMSDMTYNGNARQEKEAKDELRESFLNTVRTNAYFQNLLNRTSPHDPGDKLTNLGFEVSEMGKTSFSMKMAVFLTREGKSSHHPFSYYDLIIEQEMYATDEVSSDTAMKVEGIPLFRLRKKGDTYFPILQHTTNSVGLWQVSNDHVEWAQSTLDKLRKARDSLGHPLHSLTLHGIMSDAGREWVSDDSILVQHVRTKLESTSTKYLVIGICTKDLKLVKFIQKLCQSTVYVIDPEEVLRQLDLNRFNVVNSSNAEEIVHSFLLKSKEKGVKQVLDKRTGLVLVDTGSIVSVATQYQIHNKKLQIGKRVNTLSYTGIRYNIPNPGTSRAVHRKLYNAQVRTPEGHSRSDSDIWRSRSSQGSSTGLSLETSIT